MLRNAYLTGKKLIRKVPLNSSTEIRLTHLCTQRCRQCQVYERSVDPAIMPFDDFKTIAHRLRQYGSNIGFISGGESLLVPHLIPILEEAKKTFPVALTLVTGLYAKTDLVKNVAKYCLENNINIQTSLDGLGSLGDDLRGAKNFSETVLYHMDLIKDLKGQSKSLLYTNIVINNLNMDQVPELIAEARTRGWKCTVGLYHHLTETTTRDRELVIQDGPRLQKLIAFLDGNPDILNLNSFIRGIRPYIQGKNTLSCPFVASPVLMTRSTIMENGDLTLCWGGPIGNLLKEDFWSIFTGKRYTQRLNEYSACNGCWTTCYTQRYLLIKPSSAAEAWDNTRKLWKLKRKS